MVTRRKDWVETTSTSPNLNMSGTLTFGNAICEVCQKIVENGANTWNDVHEECERCPECGSDFTVRRAKLRPVVQRCLNCLHRWEIE